MSVCACPVKFEYHFTGVSLWLKYWGDEDYAKLCVPADKIFYIFGVHIHLFPSRILSPLFPILSAQGILLLSSGEADEDESSPISGVTRNG